VDYWTSINPTIHGVITVRIKFSGSIKTMMQRTIYTMSDREFESILDQIGENDPDMACLPDFIEVLWNLRNKKTTTVIELKAEFVK